MWRLWLLIVTGFCGPSILPRRPLWGRENAAQISWGICGRVPSQTRETGNEHLSVIVSFFLSVAYLPRYSHRFSWWHMFLPFGPVASRSSVVHSKRASGVGCSCLWASSVCSRPTVFGERATSGRAATFALAGSGLDPVCGLSDAQELLV